MLGVKLEKHWHLQVKCKVKKHTGTCMLSVKLENTMAFAG